MDVSGKSVFFVGGARGIGRGMIEVFLSKGAKVFFCDKLADRGKQTEGELQKQYGEDRVAFSECDVKYIESIKSAFEAAVCKFGAIDIWVNNAAIVDDRLVEEMMQVNLMGQIRGCQLAMDHMRRDKGGRGGLIICVVSVSGVLPQQYIPAYCATKHGLIGYTTSWAKNPKMAEMGIKWLCFCPNGTDTEFIPTDPGAVVDFEGYKQSCVGALMEISEVKEIFAKLLEQKSDDVIFFVDFDGKSRYVRRQLVDSDGVSNVLTVDTPQLVSF